jgi:hypothetical protein
MLPASECPENNQSALFKLGNFLVLNSYFKYMLRWHLMILIARLFFVSLCFFSSVSLSEDADIKVQDLGLSKYGKLTSEFYGGYSQLTAKGRFTLISINYDIKSVMWTDLPIAEKAEYFVFLVVDEAMWACPSRYVLMDARGDEPMFSPPIGNCNSADSPVVTKTVDGIVKITFLADERGNNKEEHWQYKDGVLSKIVAQVNIKNNKAAGAISP